MSSLPRMVARTIRLSSRSPPPDEAEMKRKCQNNKSQPSPDLRIRSALPSMSHTLTSHLATGRDVGNDGEVLVNTYNAIIPHNESNVKVRFDKLTTGGSAEEFGCAQDRRSQQSPPFARRSPGPKAKPPCGHGGSFWRHRDRRNTCSPQSGKNCTPLIKSSGSPALAMISRSWTQVPLDQPLGLQSSHER